MNGIQLRIRQLKRAQDPNLDPQWYGALYHDLKENKKEREKEKAECEELKKLLRELGN